MNHKSKQMLLVSNVLLMMRGFLPVQEIETVSAKQEKRERHYK